MDIKNIYSNGESILRASPVPSAREGDERENRHKHRGVAPASLNKIFAFFGNRWAKFGFSFISAGYLYFLGWIAWQTFAYHFVFDNAAAVFLLYSFINVMFAIVMIYTRKCIITKIVTLFMHPFILILLIYGFGNWYLILPPFITAAVIFFASGVNESLKVILGTIYMILFVLAFLAYITLQSLTIQIPLKMDLHLREMPVVQDEPENAPFRIVAYVDPETKLNRTARFYIERTDLDLNLWNLTCERIGRVRAGTVNYARDFELRWESPNTLVLDGRHIEIDEHGQMIIVDSDLYYHEEEDEQSEERPPMTTRQPQIQQPSV
jgi:hypothetical protein